MKNNSETEVAIAHCAKCGQKTAIFPNKWEQDYFLNNDCASCMGKLSKPGQIIRKVKDGWYVFNEINGEIVPKEFYSNNHKQVIRKKKLSKLLDENS